MSADIHFCCCTTDSPPRPLPSCPNHSLQGHSVVPERRPREEREAQRFSGYPASPLPFSPVKVTHLRALECLTSDLQGDQRLLQPISAAHLSSPCCTNKPIPDTQGGVEGSRGLYQHAVETRGHQARTLLNCCPGKERAAGPPCSAQVLSTL